MSNREYSPDCHVNLHAVPSYVLAIQLKPYTCGFTRMKTWGVGKVNLLSSEFLRKM